MALLRKKEVQNRYKLEIRDIETQAFVNKFTATEDVSARLVSDP